MVRRVKRSISRQYFATMAMMVLSSTLLLAAIFLVLAGRYLTREDLQKLDAATQRVAQSMSSATMAGVPAAQEEQMLRQLIALVAEATDSELALLDGQGRVRYASGGALSAGQALPADVLARLRQEGTLRQISDLDGALPRRCYVVGRPCAGTDGGYLLAMAEAGYFRGYLLDMMLAFFWSSVLMLLVSAILAMLAARHVSAPLTELARAADRFGRGDFSTRVTAQRGGNDEIAQLAQNFNTLAANLEAIDRSQRSFVGDIAHELRTPMTSIKGFVDGMLDGVIPAEQYPKYLGLVSEEAARLTRLIQSMLDITRIEAGEYTVNAQSYDIWQTIGAVLMNNEQRLVAGRIGVGGYAPQRTLVYADSDLVYQVVYNIVDNAIKFTPPGGRIDLQVNARAERVYVTIRNTGEGVPAEQLPHLFDRFYKGDKSRGLHSGGAGLGMHICKVLLNVSGGGIRVESDSASWTAFTFDLPAGRPELPPARRRRAGLIKFRGRSRS